jgi:hypothetical protein
MVAMPRKPKPPPDDAEQSKRFIEAAREIGADESRDAFEQVFLKMFPPRLPITARKKPGK